MRLTASYLPFLTSWDAIVSVETRQWRWECRDLPVRLFKILHAFRLECEKWYSERLWTIDLSASCQAWQVKLYQPNSSRFPEETAGNFKKRFTFRIPTRNIVVLIPAWDSLFGCFLDHITEVLVSRIHIKGIRRQQSLCEFNCQSIVMTPFSLAEVPSLNRHAWHWQSKFWCCYK